MSAQEVFFYAAWLAGVTSTVYSGGHMLWRRRHLLSFRAEKTRIGKIELLLKNRHAHALKKAIEQKTRFTGINWSFRSFLFYSFFAGLGGAFIACRYLNNGAAVLPLAVCTGLAPWAYLNWLVTKKQNILEKQLREALQYFISEYGSLPHAVSALNNTMPKTAEPLRTELDYLIRDLNSGRSGEEALFSFAERLNSGWAYRFAHILNLRMNRGLNIGAMLFNLYLDMNITLVKEKERGMETIGVRLESCLLYLFIPVMYGLACRINPQTHIVLTQTAEGRKVMFAALLLFMTGIVATFRSSNIKIR